MSRATRPRYAVGEPTPLHRDDGWAMLATWTGMAAALAARGVLATLPVRVDAGAWIIGAVWAQAAHREINGAVSALARRWSQFAHHHRCDRQSQQPPGNDVTSLMNHCLQLPSHRYSRDEWDNDPDSWPDDLSHLPPVLRWELRGLWTALLVAGGFGVGLLISLGPWR
jgi:hypothetical protein